MTFKEYIIKSKEETYSVVDINTNEDAKDKKIIKNLEKAGKTITTNPRTLSLWYSPNTSYEVISYDDGHYSHKAGVNTKGGFIPLKDIDISGLNESKKIPTWNIKTQEWENTSKWYIEAQEDILPLLKELTLNNAEMMAEEEFPNRDFNISYGKELVVMPY